MMILVSADAGFPSRHAGVTLSDAQARTGTKSYLKSGVGTHASSLFSAITPSEIYFRVANYFFNNSYTITTVNFNANQGINLFGAGSTNTKDVQIRNATTILTTLNDIIQLNTWQVWEVKQTTTETEIRLNGVTVYSQSGLTINLSNLSHLNFLTTSTWQYLYVDDIMVTDQGWPGLGGVHVLSPSGAGTHQDWTGSLPTLTTPGATSDTKHTFIKPALPVNALNVFGAGVYIKGKVDGQGFGAIKPRLGDAVGDAKGQSISEQVAEQYWDNVWTPAQFNALEFGVQSA